MAGILIAEYRTSKQLQEVKDAFTERIVSGCWQPLSIW